MSCRHDLANGTCKRCYLATGKIDPGPEENYEPNLEGPGAVTKEDYEEQCSQCGAIIENYHACQGVPE